ncbi:DNA helicase [Escherichia phage Halfdan]|uniref:DNA helicase n=1 Tax=Escherichia phage Halfdan TaxID=2234092 RepID=A0A2Z5H3D0_9CAUD|nr:DNA helicase [Escherichia phage Halfdan]AXC34306.1 DNA helicase [Escherichia phage Halfdan]
MLLRWYQDEAINSIKDYFEAGNDGNPVVALPTGTGKSIVIAEFIRRVFMAWPWQRVLMLTHVKELIEQNAAKLVQIWPGAPIGIYSAGLKAKDVAQPIIFGGVGSVVNNVAAFGHRDLILIDECHLLSDKESSMYNKIIEHLRLINPYLKVIGLTATPYRMKMGYITDNGIFTDICYDLTDIDGFNRLLAEGFLCPPIAKPTATEFDLSSVGLHGGEYAQGALERAVDQNEITYKCVSEMVEKGYDRNCWLTFASGIQHAEHVAETMVAFGIDAVAVHSKMPTKERDYRIDQFKKGNVRCIVNNGVLTTGFDHPPIDLIGMMRPTLSPGLWVQMLGRGTRPYNPDFAAYIPGFDYVKSNCLVLDFAGNTRRLGPINDPVIPKRPGKGGGDAPVRICDNCGCYNHASARWCGGSPFPTPSGCGHEFKFEPKLFAGASEEALLRSDFPQVEYFDVQKVLYSLHQKEGAPDMMKVSYFCGIRMFKEFICLEHSGFAGKRARDWWRARTGYDGDEFPTAQQAVDWSPNLRIPSKVKVWVNKKYPEIMSYEY